jgi:putative nucleotidyltransferase with HDIG domain
MKSQNELNLTELFQNVPLNVRAVSALLKYNGFEAYLVGGCVRDHIMDRIPSDYDFCTNATPEQIVSLFPRTFYENTYGTVGVVTAPDSETDEKLVKDSIVEVTPYRLESNYEDGRHPSEVRWSKNIHDDLARRDFTCNALAYDLQSETLIDEYQGLKDIENKTLKCVGDADARLSEDALRMLRAVRFACQLGFELDSVTRESVKKNAKLLEKISKERIRDEFNKILMSANPKMGIELAHDLGVLKFISHEIEAGIGIEQNQAHSFDVWKHNLLTCQHAADKGWPLELRISALFHDVSKPETRRFSTEKKDYTFYGHDVVGGRVAREILERLKYPKETIEYVSGMVRWHMFFSDTEQVTLSAVRRLISNVGKDRVWDLMNLRICDRVGTGRPKENPYRFRMYKSMVEQAMTDPVSLKMLKIDGSRIMSVTQETPGPRIGLILHALFAEVLDDPSKNTENYLEDRAIQMKSLNIEELKMLADVGKEGMDEKNAEQVSKIREKFHVK